MGVFSTKAVICRQETAQIDNLQSMNDHIQHTYNAFASEYHHKRNREADSLWNLYLDRPMIAELLGESRVAAKVLDLGCGSGLLSRWLVDQRWDVAGVDFSEELIAIAKQENPEIDFSVADVRSTPYSDGAFDVIVSGLVLHYLQDLAPVFMEVSRILMDDGVFIFTMHHPFDEVTNVTWNGTEFTATANAYFHNDEYTWTMLDGMELVSYHHTFENISTALFHAGFVIERIVEARADHSLKDPFAKFHSRTNTFPSFCGFRVRKS